MWNFILFISFTLVHRVQMNAILFRWTPCVQMNGWTRLLTSPLSENIAIIIGDLWLDAWSMRRSGRKFCLAPTATWQKILDYVNIYVIKRRKRKFLLLESSQFTVKKFTVKFTVTITVITVNDAVNFTVIFSQWKSQRIFTVDFHVIHCEFSGGARSQLDALGLVGIHIFSTYR